MPIISQSLTDTLKQILQSLQLPFLFPATVVVLVTSMLHPDIKLDDTNHLAVISIVTVILSYLLYASNIPLIRFLEGYAFRESVLFTWFFSFIGKREESRYQKLVSQVAKCDEMITQASLLEDGYLEYDLLTPNREQRLQQIQKKWESQKGLLLEFMQLRFPNVSRKLLPTALGNTIAAFEEYPWDRYCMDAVHLWPRLLPILEEKKFTPFVQNEKAVLDFLINSGLAATVIALEFFIIGLPSKIDWRYLLSGVLFLIFAYLLYHFAVTAAKHWGGMVRVAFDLYRDDLRRALYLPDLPDESLNKERELWQTISSFIVFGNDKDFKGFVYSKPQQDGVEAKQT